MQNHVEINHLIHITIGIIKPNHSENEELEN
jgi:hypothetical protein